ncbi:MAG: glycosyl hydrolase-related protein, partial [Pontiellaceae bacterium]|nr:glycosyl hydrolase-related protein [Pontiellaceae bacterium]
MCKKSCLIRLGLILLCGGFAQAGPAKNQPVMYLVGYAHLDTQWLWTYVTTINEYLPDTFNENFELFEKYPDYIFNFSGANRYRMIKEYYPADYEKMKEYIAKGRWFPCGSSWEESDVNVPSSEALIRQILYGHHYFKNEFGTESAEYMLPDCFGFPASLPSILAHCGIKGFSTQKLTWGSAVGIPFDVGRWKGPDGNFVVAALDPGNYTGKVTGDLSKDDIWLKKSKDLGKKTGFYASYHYYGVGDRGGAPKEDSVKWAETSARSGRPLKVISCKADQMFLDITEEQVKKLPEFAGDMLLTEHSSGTFTSQSYMKRWNRKNEVLADAAEKASVAAHLTGAAPYPRERLYKAWGLVLGAQFHDILPGTSIPDAYKFSQNDEVIALNSFASVLTEGVAGICRSLDTQVEGIPLAVFNALSVEREDPVEASLLLPDDAGVQVYDAAGNPVPTQILDRKNGRARILFPARVPPAGVAVFSAVTGAVAATESTDLKAAGCTIENARYRVKVNPDGDIESIFDKAAEEELLKSPAQLTFTHEKPMKHPAWNMDWRDRENPMSSHAGKPADIRIVENGPVRVALEIKRKELNSILVQTVRLSTGSAGDRVEVACNVDWQTEERALRAEFPLTVSNPMATYNWDLGKIERGNNDPKKYEVPTHGWMDLTDENGSFGVTVFCDTKYGTDKPKDNVLRWTLLYTPGVTDMSSKHVHQGSQDWGCHEFVYGLASHKGSWKSVPTDWTAMRMSQPMPVFQTSKHAGASGRSFSLIQMSSDQIAVQAIKLAENSDEVIVRLQELCGEATNGAVLRMAADILSAREVNGIEAPLETVPVAENKLTLSFTPYQLRSLALKLKTPGDFATAACQPVSLPYDTDVFSFDGEAATAQTGFDSQQRSIPAEMISNTVTSAGVTFHIGPREKDRLNAVACRGQKLDLPSGDWKRIYLLAAADEDASGHFIIG